MARVLVAEDSPTQAQQIRFILEDAGFEVEMAANGVEALAALERQQPAIVLTDLEMPEMNGLELVENIRAKHPAVPVVLMTAYGSEDIAALALQKGAASYVPKRYLAQDIVPALENILTVTAAQRDERRILEHLAEVEAQFVLGNDLDLIPPFIAWAEDNLTRLHLCDEAGLIQMSVALREALVNAIEHGNLELSSAQFEEDEKAFRELEAQRRTQEPYRSRHVYTTAHLSRTKAEFVIRDEGPGFDPSQLPDPTDPANLDRVRGRGLLLVRTFMDQVEHNEAGNQITLVKRCRR